MDTPDPEFASRRLKDRLLMRFGAWIIRVIARTLGTTCRIELVDGSRSFPDAACQLTFWHDQALLMAILMRRTLIPAGFPLSILVSRSRDGDLAALVARAWGVRVARGSASRGGRRGLRDLFRYTREGDASPMLTPDGPKGPRRQCKSGVLMLARLADIPVQPLAMHVTRAWNLHSWDRLSIPRPFSRIRVMWGEPIRLSGRRTGEDGAADAETARVQEELDRLNLVVAGR
jgi:lysophospholipid acyltransferase (LPLAT)-like uncharacterized protein